MTSAYPAWADRTPGRRSARAAAIPGLHSPQTPQIPRAHDLSIRPLDHHRISYHFEVGTTQRDEPANGSLPSPLEESIVLKKSAILALILLALTSAGAAAAPLAAADESDGTEQSEPEPQPRNSDDAAGLINIGDLQLLSNLNVCPDVNVLVPIGNVLGILGSGTATATTADAPITCAVVSTGRQVGNRTGG
jgi:hypothetical protein